MEQKEQTGEHAGITLKAVMKVDNSPSESQMKETAALIWSKFRFSKDGDENWDKFTIHMYLPDMSIDNDAYSTREFGRYGLLSTKEADEPPKSREKLLETN